MIDIDFKFYLALFWRRFALFLLVFLTITMAGITLAYILPSIYKSQATILVTPPATNTIQGTLTTLPAQELESIRKKMMTRDNLRDIADRLRVFEDRPEMSPSAQIREMATNTSFQLTAIGEIVRSPRFPPNAVTFAISYRSKNPNVAARVTNELTSLMLDESTRNRTEIAAEATRFYEQEAQRIEGRLTDLERQIVLFKTENSGALPASLPIRMQRVAGIEGQLRDLEIQIQDLTDQRDQIRAAIDNPALLPQTGQPLSPEEQQLKALKSQLAVKRGTFSEQHPEIWRLNAEIGVLEEIIKDQLVNIDDTSGAPTQLQLNLAALEKQLENLARQQADLNAELAELNVSVARTPDVEMQFNILNRSLAGLQQQFDQAVNLRNAAERGETVEANRQGFRYELLQRANVPESPESPNRLLIAAASVAAGLGAGLGLLVLLEILNQSIRRPTELVSGLGIQPFATIPYIATRAEIIRSRLRIAASLAVVAVGLPALLYFVHYTYVPLDLLLSNMLERFGLGGLAASLS